MVIMTKYDNAVAIHVMDFNFVLFYFIIFFQRSAICSCKNVCLKPKIIVTFTNDVHKIEKEYKITG